MDDGETRRSGDWLAAGAEVGRLLHEVERKYEPRALASALMAQAVRQLSGVGDPDERHRALHATLRFLALVVHAEGYDLEEEGGPSALDLLREAGLPPSGTARVTMDDMPGIPARVSPPAAPLAEALAAAPAGGTVTVRLPGRDDGPQLPPPGVHLMGAVQDRPGMPGYLGCTLCGARLGAFDPHGPCPANTGPRQEPAATLDDVQAVVRQMLAERALPPTP